MVTKIKMPYTDEYLEIRRADVYSKALEIILPEGYTIHRKTPTQSETDGGLHSFVVCELGSRSTVQDALVSAPGPDNPDHE